MSQNHLPKPSPSYTSLGITLSLHSGTGAELPGLGHVGMYSPTSRIASMVTLPIIEWTRSAKDSDQNPRITNRLIGGEGRISQQPRQAESSWFVVILTHLPSSARSFVERVICRSPLDIWSLKRQFQRIKPF